LGDEERIAKRRSVEELERITAHARREGRDVVWANGCFEILHTGHIEFLTRAARLGEMLIVGVNSDSSVRALRGEGHPLSGEWERMLVLSALECVDYVTSFAEPTCEAILRRLQPSVYAKGLKHVQGDVDPGERAAVEAYGGVIALVGGTSTASTSRIIERVMEGPA
jgi:D-beta-D-heptose 7-phosphate kinase/D-beta-D-heptose 1-phosphate adenosyltransferase